MLVLARCENEGIRIGDDIHIVVVETSSGRCRLGIEAPKEISVHRDEVYETIQRAARTQAAGGET